LPVVEHFVDEVIVFGAMGGGAVVALAVGVAWWWGAAMAVALLSLANWKRWHQRGLRIRAKRRRRAPGLEATR